ncbi:M20 family metallopeptidase [Brevibacterium litoralis]|uniref:M20 family metallopeptidase n=1 Tax=Brevibacterium litoralis TaxID=3138935 RepID=UPI0032EB1FAB
MPAPIDPTALVTAAQTALPQILADIERVISIETPSDDKEAVARGAAEFADLIEERLGVRPETLVIGETTHLRLRFGADNDGSEGSAKVVLVNHQDTVWPHGTLERKPVEIEDGVLRGPGCFDMLTGAVMSIHATRMLQEQLGTSALDGLTILVTGDEEIGSTDSSDLIVAEAKGANAAFVMEASAHGALKVARKGTSDYRVTVTGRAAHSGLEPEKGVNALVELAHQVQVVAGLGDEEAGTTVVPTKFAGGTTTNTVPAEGTFAVDVRCRTVAEQERVDAAIRALTPQLPGATIAVTGGINRPPLENSMTAGLFERAVAVSADLGIDAPEGVAVGGASDGNFTAAAGVPTLDGLGADGDGAHAEHEHAIVDQIPPRTARLAALIADQLG